MPIFKKHVSALFAKTLIHSSSIYHYFANVGFITITKTTTVT